MLSFLAKHWYWGLWTLRRWDHPWMERMFGEQPYMPLKGCWARVLLITGLDYWTHIFLVFTHSEVTFVVSLQTRDLQGAFCPLIWGLQEEKTIISLRIRCVALMLGFAACSTQFLVVSLSKKSQLYSDSPFIDYSAVSVFMGKQMPNCFSGVVGCCACSLFHKAVLWLLFVLTQDSSALVHSHCSAAMPTTTYSYVLLCCY